MTPSTWPALIVGAFTILNPSTNVGPTTSETDVAPVTFTATQPAFAAQPLLSQSYTLEANGELSTTTDLGTITIAAPTTVTGTGADGKPYSFTINPTAPGVAVITPSMAKPFEMTSIDNMPVVGYGSDPNKMDHMCWWDGTDPNKIDHMAYGYDPATTKFYNCAGSTTLDAISPTSDAWKKYFKNFSPVTPPAMVNPLIPKPEPGAPVLPPSLKP